MSSTKERVIATVTGKQEFLAAPADQHALSTATVEAANAGLDPDATVGFASDIEFHLGEELDSLFFPDTRVLENSVPVESTFKFSKPLVRTADEQASHYLRISDAQREEQQGAVSGRSSIEVSSIEELDADSTAAIKEYINAVDKVVTARLQEVEERIFHRLGNAARLLTGGAQV